MNHETRAKDLRVGQCVVLRDAIYSVCYIRQRWKDGSIENLAISFHFICMKGAANYVSQPEDFRQTYAPYVSFLVVDHAA